MKTGLTVGALLAIATTALTSAHGDDAIKPGKWQYTVSVQMPQMANLPPDVKLPKGVELRVGGMTITHTDCLATGDPAEAVRRLDTAAKGRCNIERMDRAGSTFNWSMSCGKSDAVVHIDGTARYSGTRMEADIIAHANIHGASPGASTAHVTGHYLGPCGGN
jgi:hypothetical protein